MISAADRGDKTSDCVCMNSRRALGPFRLSGNSPSEVYGDWDVFVAIHDKTLNSLDLVDES